MSDLPLKEHYAKLAAFLTEKSAEYDNDPTGCGDDDMYVVNAYISQSGRLLDICGADYWTGTSMPYAVITLPWRGSGPELEILVDEQVHNQEYE